jgi:hypothetical protein
MKSLLAVVALAALLLTSCGATLTVRGTAPTQLNDGSCATPVLSPASSMMMVHARAGTSREDSVAVLPGNLFTFTWQVPAGGYPIRCWVSLVAVPYLVGCDFCTTSPAFKPEAFNQRTCHRCAAAGAPDQSKVEWGAYRKLAADWARLQGRRAPLSGAALEAKAGLRAPGTRISTAAKNQQGGG